MNATVRSSDPVMLRFAAIATGVFLTLAATPGTAAAQTTDAPGRVVVNFSGGFDVLPGSAYIFRGITQEASPELTLWPSTDFGVTLATAEHGLKNVRFNFGTWNSLHTGSSGLGASVGKMYYERDFYGSLSAALSGDVTVSTTYTAYTSPNGMFGTVRELAFKAQHTDRVSPYVIVAKELHSGAAADGSQPGTYMEIGASPSFPLSSKYTLSFPSRVGVSLRDYYQHPQTGVDHPFGYADLGIVFTRSMGAWNVHAGLDAMRFGKTTAFFNGGDVVKVTGLLGLGWSY
jgi:hypothetical protein